MISFGEWGQTVHRVSCGKAGIPTQMPYCLVTAVGFLQQPKEVMVPISKSMTRPTVQYRKSPTHTSTLMAMHKFRTATLMATTNHHSSCPMTVPMVPSQRPIMKLSFSTGLKLMARSWSIGFRLITQSAQLSLLKLIQALLSTLAAATKSPKYLSLVIPKTATCHLYQKPARWWSMHRTCHILAVQSVQPTRLQAL